MDDLCQAKIIDEALAERVRNETAKDTASGLVYQHLVRQADGGHLDRVCSIMMAKESFPRMRKWAEIIRNELQLCEWSSDCVCVCSCMLVRVGVGMHVCICVCVVLVFTRTYVYVRMHMCACM